MLYFISLLFVITAPVPLEPLYQRIAAELQAGRPLVVVMHHGLWFKRQDQPERNLNWGMRDSSWNMMRKARRTRSVTRFFRHARWEQVKLIKRTADPLRIAVFRQRIRPNARWRALGVTEPFTMYAVLLAWQDQSAAGVAMGQALFRDQGLTVDLDDDTRLDLGKAQAVGYLGHNFFYDHDFDYPPLTDLARPLRTPKGFFAIGCKTGQVPGFKALLKPNIHALLLTHGFMAVEGHSTLALLDGLAQAHPGPRLARLANRAYKHFRNLANPPAKSGTHFWPHDPALLND